MTTHEIYGDFPEDLPDSDQFLVISFSPSSIPLKQRWRNNGLSADFMADYLTTFFPVDEDNPQSVARQKELRAGVSYIANELLENAMKFHDEKTEDAIKFGIRLLENTVVLFSSNCVSSETWLKFKTIINNLITCDLEELYVAQLEKLAEDENSKASGLGLITIMNDYGATLGWKIEKDQETNDLITINTIAKLVV
ncbi:MAG TPA: ATP-binding protein [Cyanothece sp. UBA12306]|nr:ATP-binding protein [Cyanothece sp. UBA12306]